MKRIFKYFSMFLCSFILLINSVYAASYDVSVTSNSVTVGNNVTLTIKGNELAGKFTLSSSNTSVASLSSGSIWIDNNSDSITIKTSAAGTATITITPTDVTSYDGNTITGNKSVTITVKNKQTNNSSNSTYVPKTKSSNNNLTSLTIDGVDLDSKFNKDTLEYSATISAGIEKIKINAQLADSSASVSGIGEKEVKVGENKFEIKVTAENGNVKTYVINATVLEPKKIELEDKKYTIVGTEGVLEVPVGYEKSTIKIEDEDVLSYYNETTKYNLVILKDEEGNSNYYLYDDGKYTLYKEYNFSGVRLYLLNSRTPDNYVERELVIGDEKIPAYQLDISKKNTTYALDSEGISDYYLVYGMNINTGMKNYYLVDKLENTAIRYSENLMKINTSIEVEKSNFRRYFFILLGVIGAIILLFGIYLMISNGKKRHKSNFK